MARGAAGGGGGGEGRAGKVAGGCNVGAAGGLRSRVGRAGRTAAGARTPLPPWPFRRARKGMDGMGGEEGGESSGRVGLRRSLSPRGRAEQLQSAGERAVGRALRGERALRGAAAGVRGAGLPLPRRGRGAHAAPAGDSAPRRAALRGHRDLLLASPPCFYPLV